MTADWSQLPMDLLLKIAAKLNLYSDYVRFRAVCHWWRSSIPEKPKHIPHQFPCLMLPPATQDKPNDSDCYGFLSIFLGEVYPIELAQVRDKLIRGSSHGWVVTVEKGLNMHLINPLTNSKIQLPPLTAFPELLELCDGEEHLEDDDRYYEAWTLAEARNFFIQKVVLSASPSTNSYTAMAIYSEKSYLAFCKQPGAKLWIEVDGFGCYRDIVFHKEKFYAVDSSAELHVVVDLDSNAPWTRKIAGAPSRFRVASNLYLVESYGDLLLVARNCTYTSSNSYNTVNFRVYKLNLDSTSLKGNWSKQLDTLGDRVLFLGFNHSLSFPSGNFPGCQGDCIYFTDDNFEGHEDGEVGGADIGVFNYRYKTFHPIPAYEPHSQLILPPPVWIFPSA